MNRSGKLQGSSRKSHLSAFIMLMLLALALTACDVSGMLTPTEGFDGTSKVTIGWDANPESEVTGYKVYCGVRSGTYETCRDAGRRTTFELEGLEEGRTYYLVVTAYSSTGAESGYSREIVYTAS